MMHSRYERIRFSNHLSVFVITFIAFGIGIISFALKLFVEGLIFEIVVILSLLNVGWPYFERYSICDNVITVQRPHYTTQITIPKKTVIVISQADVHPAFGHQSFLIKEKLAVSIIQEMTLTAALELLHGKHPSQFLYTNGTIEKSLDEYKFVYSFVYAEEPLNQVLQSTECVLIIPASIKHRVAIENLPVQVYIDCGY